MTTVAQTTEIVKFNNQELLTLKVGEIIYTAIRPIVEGMGLDWTTQAKKLRNNAEKFNCRDMPTVAQDGKIREMLCMPIKKLNGWLFSINPEKVKPEIKDDVIAYQEECFEALYNYWHKGEAVNPRFEKISDTQAYKLKTAVEKRCKNNKEHYQTVWTALKHRFEVPKYTDILVKDFDNAMNLVWTIALPPVVEKPQPQTPTDKELYEILHAAVSSHHQLHRMTKSLAVTLHVRDTIDYQLRNLREDIIRIVKFANNHNLYNKLGLPLVSHEARLNAWDGASWSIATTA